MSVSCASVLHVFCIRPILRVLKRGARTYTSLHNQPGISGMISEDG